MALVQESRLQPDRRAVAVIRIDRPLHGVAAFDHEGDIAVADATGETQDRPYGFTYSDLRKRLVPDAVLTAYRSGVPISYEILVKTLETVQPTRPFSEAGEK